MIVMRELLKIKQRQEQPQNLVVEKTMPTKNLTLITVLLLSLAGTEVSASGVPMKAETKSGYAPIHGMQLYYEIHGQGKPMVLLHGGITAFEGFATNIDDLAKSRQVIAVHLQGHDAGAQSPDR